MAEPPDQIPAAGRGHLRASHADRERVVGILKAAFVQGRLAKDELDLRTGQAPASRTYAELAAHTADLPGGLAAAKPLQPERAQDGRPGRWIAVAAAVNAAIWAYLLFLSPHGGDNSSFPPLVFLGGIIFVMTSLMSVATMIELRREKRSLTDALWPADAEVPKGWQRDVGSVRLKPVGTNSTRGPTDTAPTA
jgi:uncharacterized protein DUF1707